MFFGGTVVLAHLALSRGDRQCLQNFCDLISVDLIPG
jgi:hypothetical protein